MATYYWVGGSGTWDNANTTNWSASSGGAGGAGVPGAADNAFIDANSGNGVITLGSDVTVRIVVFTAFTGTLDFGAYKITVAGGGSAGLTAFQALTTMTVTGNKVVEFTYSGGTGSRNIVSGPVSESNSISFKITAGSDVVAFTGTNASALNVDFTGFSGSFTPNAAHKVYGDFTLSATMTVTPRTSATIFAATSGTKLITTNGVTMDSPITFDGAGGTWRLEDNLTIGSTRAMTLTNGTLNANNKNVSIGTFATAAGGAKVLTLGNGTWTVAGATWNTNTDAADVTVNPGTSTISMTSASAKTFSGGGKTFNVLNQGGAGALTISGSNTFANITNTVQPATIRFTAGTTQTVSAFGVAGTAGNLITLDTTVAGTRATLSDASGVNSVSYCSIKDINATGGAFWQAYTVNGNVDGGNNLGWDFNATAWSYMYNVRKSKRILPGV